MAAILAAIVRSDGPIQTGYPATFTGQVNVLLESWDLQMDFTGACMVGIMAAMDAEAALRIPRAANHIAGNALQIAMAGAQGGNLTENALAAAAPSDEKTFLTLCASCRTKGLTWLLDLVIAEQHKRMKPDNVVSYYMMQTNKRVNGAKILKLIEPAASAIGNIRNTNAAAIPNTVWMRYRTSATSTPGLILRALEIWGDVVPNLMTVETRDRLTAAAAEPWNVALTHAIPDRLVVLTHATLKAFNMLPNGWYYGETVYSRCSGPMYSGYFETARKIKDVGGNVQAIREAENLIQLQTAIPDTLTGI